MMDRIIEGFEEQVELLVSDCLDYDNGNEAKYKRIATSLWVLFGVGGQNSIIGHFQRHLKTRIMMLDTCEPINRNNLMDSFNLIMMGIGIREGKQEAKYFPIMDNDLPSGTTWPKRVKVSDWWDGKAVLMIQSIKSKFTRANLVKLVRNEMGGAHFEAQISELEILYGKHGGPFFASIKPPLIGEKMTTGKSFDNSALGAQIRQIGHEALRTFSDIEFPIKFRMPEYKYKNPMEI